jgi:cell division protein FtsQ
MEIRTNIPRDTKNTRIVPPPDKARHRKKASQKPGNGSLTGRRLVATLKVLGKLFALLVVGAFMVSVFIYAYNANTFNLLQIRIDGCKELNPAQLEGIIHREFPANILRIDLPKLKNRLEQETWVKQAEVRRILPSDLIVYIKERTPSVILELQEELMIADNAGILLGLYDPKFGKLDVPVFKGLMGEDAETYVLYQEENTARINQALEMLSEIEAGLPQYTKNISEVDVSDRNKLKIMLVDETAEINLGEKNYLKRLLKLTNNPEYRKMKDQNIEFESIDLTLNRQIRFVPRKAKNESLINKPSGLEEQRQRNR